MDVCDGGGYVDDDDDDDGNVNDGYDNNPTDN